MNIVHLYDGHESISKGEGSVPDVVWNLAKNTKKKGHSVTIIERKWKDTPDKEIRSGVQFKRIPLQTGPDSPWERIPYEMVQSPIGMLRLMGDRLNFSLKSYNKLRKMDFDIIHVHLPFAANILVTLFPWLRKQMVCTAHIGETEKRVSEPIFSPDIYLAKRVAQQIVLNPETESIFRREGVPQDNLQVIPNGVEVDKFESINEKDVSEVQSKYNIVDEEVGLFAGTITPRKGVLELVEAIDKIPKDDLEKYKFLIVGNKELNPDYVDEIQQLVQEKGLNKYVSLPGFIPMNDLRILYDLADVFILPSFEEGSSVAITEAIASGTPVIATDIGGNAQQINSNHHGFLVEPGNESELARCINRILSNPTIKSQMEDNMRKRAEELSWCQVTEKYIRAYQRVTR